MEGMQAFEGILRVSLPHLIYLCPGNHSTFLLPTNSLSNGRLDRGAKGRFLGGGGNATHRALATADGQAAASSDGGVAPLITSRSMSTTSPREVGYWGNSTPVRLRITQARPSIACQTPRKRGRKRDLYTNSASGKSHRPKNISSTTSP